MITFEFTPQRSGGFAVTKYNEDGRHIGAVAVVERDADRGPLIRIPKAVTFAGLRAILERIEAENPPLGPARNVKTEPTKAEPAVPKDSEA